jgi:hypothetical protein
MKFAAQMSAECQYSEGGPMPGKQLLFLELNEINFDFVKGYITRGELPNLARLLSRHGYSLTTSETQYDHIEPWIQWVTAHTGLRYAEHRVLRLGDIVQTDLPQIWETLEARGLKVGAISPMNASCRVKSPAFFVPDPWTNTDVRAPAIIRRLHSAISRVVNANASSKIPASSFLNLIVGVIAAARPASYVKYVRMALSAINRPWHRALFLDLLLADLFIKLTKARKPDFATIFLNAGAHIQHHYLFSSREYKGPRTNPEWYIDAEHDPVLDVYRLYDGIVSSVMSNFPESRIMLATGLHQEPFPDLRYYWRLKEHNAFIKLLRIDSLEIRPLMSRDFVIVFSSPEEAAVAQNILDEVYDDRGVKVFSVDNRGDSLFVMLVYPDEITQETVFSWSGGHIARISDHVSFVALKNGHHDGVGYFVDSGAERQSEAKVFPLTEMPDRVERALVA